MGAQAAKAGTTWATVAGFLFVSLKRFTETTKWADPWFRKLPLRLKSLWHWLCDTCDMAGVLERR
jgi:hypothetical protein